MKCELAQSCGRGFTIRRASASDWALLVGISTATISPSPADRHGVRYEAPPQYPRSVDRLEIPASPFTKSKGLPRCAFTGPILKSSCRSTLEWTAHGKLRHPRLLGVRHDKAARDVVREAP
jgi:hypothetical protein